MCAKREEEVGERFQPILEDQEIQQQNMGGVNDYSYSNTRLMFPSSSSEIMLHHQQPSWTWSSSSLLNQNSPLLTRDPFVFPPPPPPPSSLYGGLLHRRGLLFGCSSSDHLLSEAVGSGPFTEMTAQEMMDAKALAASKSHSEAERRRRERINNHLAKLRSLLPNTTKTDKASLLAEVIQHVKELKRQTSIIAEQSPVPTEIDELTVDKQQLESCDGKLVIRASLCCDDRSDLLPDLINTLKALRLTTLKADITTLAGRVKNVLFITAADANDHNHQMLITTIQQALKQVMDKSNAHDSSSASVKRQRIVHP